MAFWRSRGIRILLVGAGLLLLAGLGAGVGFYMAFVRDLPDLRSLDDYRPPLASHVYDRDGRPIGQFFRERRSLASLDQLPDHVVRAFVAGEDSTFFEHSGIDYMSILRAAWVNVLAGGEIKQGGSTITQQMVKTLLLSPERSYRRKIREMVLARDIESRFSKQDILYLYLNQIYFGHGAYGIAEAADTYFAKDVTELTISEGAMLAGLPKAPSRYSPHANPDQAEGRRRYVLERMLADDFLDARTYQAALEDVPVLAQREDAEQEKASAYFVEAVRRQLFETLGGDEVLEGGLVIETTVDAELQLAAVEAVRAGLTALSHRQGYRGPKRRVAREEITGEILRLAEDNGFVERASEGDDPALEMEAAEAADPVEDAEISADGEPAAVPDASLEPGAGPFLGVVTATDAKAKRARIAFAPGLEGTVQLKDVSWAREPDPDKAPRRVRSIDKVFSVGDVVAFDVLPSAEGDEAADDALPRVTIHQEPDVEGALFSIDVETDEVIALVGGYAFERSQFDRVTQARRQPGSAFKPLIYGAAIDQGYTPASIIFDRPVVYTDEASGFVWRPRNYGRSFYGPITLREALARSVNNATVHLFRDVGVDYVMDFAERLGIESPLTRDLSLALGSSGVSLFEITRAYAVFPALGRRVEPVFIRRVTNRDGEVVLENVPLGQPQDRARPDNVESDPDLVDVAADLPSDASGNGHGGNRVIPAEHAYLVTDLLRAVVVDPDGTGWRLRDLKRPVAGKTGTTNDQGDAWFMGFSPEVVTGVWVGHDSVRFLGWGETGSRAAAPIWVQYMKAALAKRPVRDFEVPEEIVFARINRKTGLLASGRSKETVFQSFLTDTVPTETSESEKIESEGRRLLRFDGL
jgi:penicillin-binding protein 1A